MTAKLLFVDDDDALRDVVGATLIQRGFEVLCVAGADEALAALESGAFGAVLSDLNMPGMSGLDFCRRAHMAWPDLPIILLTAFGSMETAVAAIRAGAYDFITKPIQVPELLLTLARALEHRELKQENKQLREAQARRRPPADILGESLAMQEIYELLGRLTETEASVLVTGESGTGKEWVAQALHQQGPNRTGPFVALNCAAVPEAMLESELFGHMRGAFTDAKANRKGLFVQADNGTLFLDEIGEMPPGTQVKLLRALQERKVRPVGGDHELPFSARIVSATSRDLVTDVAEGRFRQDLFYRINVIHVSMPPLRARGNDVLLIAEALLRRFAAHTTKQVSGLSSAAAEKLLTYPWPGNVRELQNCMERAVALTRTDSVVPADLPAHIREFQGSGACQRA